MEKWRYWLLKPGAGKWLRLGSLFIITGMLLTVLVITSGVLAAPHHEQQTAQALPGKSIGSFKQQIVMSPTYTINRGVKSSLQSCPSNTILTGGGYQLVKGSSGVIFTASYPSTTNPSTWTVTANNPTSQEATFRVYAICLSIQAPDPTPTPRATPTSIPPQPVPTPVPRPTPVLFVPQPTPTP